MSAKLTAMMLGVATVSQASAARVLLAEQMNCGDLGQEWCADESCKYDYLPVNLGGSSTICRKKEEAEASGGIMGDGKGNGGGGDSGADDMSGGDSGADNMGGGDMPQPESMPESMPESSPSGDCGGERQPVCAGDQMNGRNFECDYGFVGENGTCVPYEDHITSTPVPSENSMLAQRGSEPTDDDIRNSPLMQALNGIGGGDQPVPAGFEPDPNPEVDNDMGEVADGGDGGMVTPPATTPTPPSTTAPGVGGTGSPTGQAFSGHITHFDAMGVPHGGCGVSMERSVDDNGKKLPFLAFNTNSLFENGANCGRWVEITLEENCDGGGNGQWSICQGGNGFQNDEHTGEIIYGYVLDSCGDNNFWCQNDPGHLDLSTPYLQSLGLIGEHFNARKSSWSFMDGAPPGWSMSSLKFQWMQGAQWLPDGYGFHAPLVIYNTDNGISAVEILDPNGTWKPAAQLTNLGNVWDLPEPSDMRNPAARQFTIRVTDMSGNYYGEQTIPFSCGTTVCGSTVDVGTM